VWLVYCVSVPGSLWVDKLLATVVFWVSANSTHQCCCHSCPTRLLLAVAILLMRKSPDLFLPGIIRQQVMKMSTCISWQWCMIVYLLHSPCIPPFSYVSSHSCLQDQIINKHQSQMKLWLVLLGQQNENKDVLLGTQ